MPKRKSLFCCGSVLDGKSVDESYIVADRKVRDEKKDRRFSVADKSSMTRQGDSRASLPRMPVIGNSKIRENRRRCPEIPVREMRSCLRIIRGEESLLRQAFAEGTSVPDARHTFRNDAEAALCLHRNIEENRHSMAAEGLCRKQIMG